MRIIGGQHRGRRLIGPEGQAIRPTGDRVREALFNILEHGRPALRGARFLDLFCGSGAIGLEAFSRGAAAVTLVDLDTGLAARNLAALGSPAEVRLLRADATRLGPAPHPFDLVVLDPPYQAGLAMPTLQALAGGWLAPEARVVVETAARGAPLNLPPGYRLEQERRYGAARLVLLHPVG